jgi:2-methylcitrate dehydratase PrpD
VLSLRREVGEIAPEEIELIAVETYQTAIDVTGNFSPRTANEARFSLPYVVCHALLYGSVRLGAFAEQRLADQSIRGLLQRVSLTSDPKLSAGFPSMRAARVRITTKDGREFEHFSPYRKGDPEAPLTDAELGEKFDELVAPVIGANRADDLREKLWRLDRLQLAELSLTQQGR